MPDFVVNEWGEKIELNFRDDKLSGYNYHGYCGGYVDKYVVSGTHAILRCRVCNLRIHVPVSVQTIEDFQNFFKDYSKEGEE